MPSRAIVSVFILALTCGLFLQYTKDSSPPQPPLENPAKSISFQKTLESPPRKTASLKTQLAEDSPAPAATTILAGDVCAWINRSRGSAQTTRNTNLKSLLPLLPSQEQATLTWLFPEDSTEPEKISEDSKSDPVELVFLKALEISGNLLGRSSPVDLDVKKGIELLKQAQALDPSNGALDLYLASLYQRQSEYNLANKHFERGLRAERFDVYMNSFSKKLLGAPQNAVGFVQGLELFSVLPIPDLTPLRETLLARTRVQDSEELYRFAQRLAESAIQSKSPYNHLDWWLGSYVMARDILRQRGNDLPPPFELHKEFVRFPDIPLGEDRDACNTATLERQIAEFQDLIRR